MYESSDPATAYAIALLIGLNQNLQDEVTGLKEAQSHRQDLVLSHGQKFHVYHLFNPATGEDYVGASRMLHYRLRNRFRREAKFRDENPCDWRVRVISHHSSLLEAEDAEARAIAQIQPTLNGPTGSFGLVNTLATSAGKASAKDFRLFPVGKILLVDALVNLNYKVVKTLQRIGKLIPEPGDRITVPELRDHYHNKCGATWSEYIRKSQETDTAVSRWFIARNIKGIPGEQSNRTTPGYFIRGDS